MKIAIIGNVGGGQAHLSNFSQHPSCVISLESTATTIPCYAPPFYFAPTGRGEEGGHTFFLI